MLRCGRKVCSYTYGGRAIYGWLGSGHALQRVLDSMVDSMEESRLQQLNDKIACTFIDSAFNIAAMSRDLTFRLRKSSKLLRQEMDFIQPDE